MPFQPPAQKVRPKIATPKGKQKQPVKQNQASKQTQDTRTQSSERQTQSQSQSTSQRVTVGNDHAQSIQAVRELVTNVVSSLFYLRDIIPEDSFVSNSIPVPQRIKSNGSITPAAQLPVKQLRRDYSEEANDALNWLDYGIIEALNKGYLKSLIVYIYLKEDTRNRALEAYTFNFDYDSKKKDAEGNVVEGMDTLRMSPEKPVKDAFGQASRRLIREACRAAPSLAKLPKEVKFDFKLFFTDNTPEDFQPPAFKPDDDSETFLATHTADEVPYTLDVEACADTGLHGVSLHIASVTHWLPEQEPIEEDPLANSNEQKAMKDAADREHQMAVEEDDPDRDILWPLEQSIYGNRGSSAKGSTATSQLESASVEPTTVSSFTHPTGQLLVDGSIKAIPKDKLRWSDDQDQLVRVRRRATPIQDRKAFAGKSIYEPWNNATQDNSQRPTQAQMTQPDTQATQGLPRAHSHQQESATEQDPEPEEMEMELDIEHNDEAAQATQVNEAEPPASQESSTDVESDQNKDGDFDITKLPKLPPLATLPKKTLAKKKTMSLNPAKKTSKKTIKGPTAMQVPTPFKPKPKSRPKKAADGVVSAAKKTQKSKVKQPPTATTTGTTNGAGGRVKERPNINRHAPLNLAQIQPTQSDIDDPDDFANPTPKQPLFFPLSPDTATQPSQQEPMQHHQPVASQGRHHPYARPASAGPSSQSRNLPIPETQASAGASSQSSLLPVPQTHSRRIRSSRGIRGVDPKTLPTPLFTIAEDQVADQTKG